MRRCNSASNHPRTKLRKNEARTPDGSFGRPGQPLAGSTPQVLEKVEASPGSKGKVRIIIESKDNVKPEYFEITGEIVQITG